MPSPGRALIPRTGVHLGNKRLDPQSFNWESKRNKSNSNNTHVSARPAHLLFSILALLLVLGAALYPAKAFAQSISVIQRATLNQQPSSGGSVTLTLPKATGAGHALIVGVSFWPLDLTSVADNSGDAFTRGLSTSIYHNVSQGVLYTNFYYARNTAGGATTLTLNFSGGSTYVVAAVSEVAGLDPSAPLDSAAYHESLSSTTPWSSAALATSTANEYLFAWAADEWTNPSCSNPTAGWTVTQNTAGGTLCLVDRIVSGSGSYQVSVTPAAAFNYAMEMVAFKGATSSPAPAPVVISTTTLPSGTVGSTYSSTLAATGGVSPYTWSASGLPAGLSISASGTISGTPTTMGTQMSSLTVKDASGTTASSSLSLTIGSAGLPPKPSTTLSLLHFGNAGFGGDDTSVFQTAINYTAANSETLEIPAGSYNVSPLFLPTNSYLIVDANVTVTANSGFGTSDHLLNANAQNITIAGAGATTSVFRMRKAEYTSGEWRHCLDIENASNVTVSGISCNDSGGDGAYVRASSNVTIEDSIFDNNRRQGSSITGQVNHIYYLRDQFTNTNGTAPQSGIDIEPNTPGDFLLDVNITDCSTNNNAGDGLLVSLWLMDSTSQPVGITVQRHHSTGNQRYGYIANNNDPSNAPGTILIQDSFSDQSGSYGATGRFYAADGASLTFKNLTVTNPHVNGPDPSYGDSAAVDIIRGGGGTVPIGNVHFLNINIAVTNGMVDHYFNFADGSGMSVTNVQFVPGTLSGATQVPPNGLMNGTGYNSIP
jgi:putative Ig domain-containing protein/parallel beta helix pectate lyase-like protein